MGSTRSRCRGPTRVVELSGGEHRHLRRDVPRTSGSSRADGDAVRLRARPEENARSRCGPCSAASAGHGALAGARERRRRDLRGRPGRLARGRACERPRSRSTRAPRRACWSAIVRRGAALRERTARRPGGGHARGGRRGASASGRCRSSSARSARGREGRPFAEALVAPRHVADRRAQAALAVGRRRSARAPSVAEIVRAYERGGAAAVSVLTEEAHFGGSLADLREARAATRAADPAQGLHGRPVPALRGQGRRRRRGAAGGRVARRATSSAELLREAQATSTWTRSWRCTTSEELEAALEVGRRRDRHQQPRPRRTSRVDLQRTFDLIADVPAGKVVVSESGIRTRDADRGARAAWAWTPC